MVQYPMLTRNCASVKRLQYISLNDTTCYIGLGGLGCDNATLQNKEQVSAKDAPGPLEIFRFCLGVATI